MTYEPAETVQYLDPGVSYFSYDFNIMQNVYEPLIWYNGSCSTCAIPWLAKNYTSSSDLKTYTFTLRDGIKFQDGEPLNSTAVYFSLNRLLVEDGSSPVGHGTQASWLIWQLLNSSFSSTLSGHQKYDKTYVDNVLKQNFVEVTGPLTFTLHVQHPTSAFPYLLAGDWAFIVAPNYVIQHDLALWSTSSAGYTLPNPTPSGSTMNRYLQYYQDAVATCDSGSTPKGCGTTYLDGSFDGSQAGTGPYSVQSNNKQTNDIVLKANTAYWGGAYQFSNGKKITPQITTINFNFVPDQSTREIDLQNAAKSGQAMAIDVQATNLYDIADRHSWINDNKLVSTIPGVSMYGAYTIYTTLFDPFSTNVTNALTGQYYKFQPFADIRFRLAFADSVNMTEINNTVNNKMGQVAVNVVAPGLPPTGSFNSSITPRYKFNTTAVQQLLLDAMQHPITSFKFANGTAAPSGLFDNTFGCSSLGSNGQCANPVAQTVPLVFATGDTVDEQIFNAIAGTINNISTTYNMGLTVTVTPLPSGQELTEALSVPNHLYMYSFGWIDDYPWVLDFLGPMLAPGQTYTGPDGWNIPQMGILYQQAVNASQKGDIAGIIAAGNAMNKLSNDRVMYLWTLYQANFITMTSNIQGFYFNPSLSTAAGGGVGPEYFATLY